MNIALAANDSYIEHLAVTLVSILINSNVNDRFKFYILSNDISEESKKKLKSLKKIKNFEIDFLIIKENAFINLPTKYHYTKQIYYRLCMPELIKEDRVLYLDSDIIVRKSLKDFYETDLKDNVVAVIEDLLIGNEGDKDNIHRKIVKSQNYFNSGVMLWDLKKAKEQNIADRCVRYIQENAELLAYFDQDALNYILDGMCLFKDKKYNFQYNRHFKNIKILYNNLKKKIIIIHFVTSIKPWNVGLALPFILEYYYYAFLTPWRYQAFNNLFCNILFKNLSLKLEKTKFCLKIYSI